jgi:hypothetical protein
MGDGCVEMPRVGAPARETCTSPDAHAETTDKSSFGIAEFDARVELQETVPPVVRENVEMDKREIVMQVAFAS